MASKNKGYNPWPDKKTIGRLLEYESTAEAYEQLMWRQRYGSGSVGYRGCPHCRANPQVMGLGKKIPAHFPYICKKCGGSIGATIDTPMFGSKIPLPVWFDCMYLFMGGYDKGKAPLLVTAEYTSDDLQRRYGLARTTATNLKFNVRDLVFPSERGLWGDELPGMYVNPDSEGAWERFESAVNMLTKAPLPKSTKNGSRDVDMSKPFTDVEGIPRKYERECEHCGRIFATDMPDRWYCCGNCRDIAGEITENKREEVKL